MKPPTVISTAATTRARSRKAGARRRVVPWVIGGVLLAVVINAMRPRPIEVEMAAVTSGPLTVSVLEEGKTRIRHR